MVPQSLETNPDIRACPRCGEKTAVVIPARDTSGALMLVVAIALIAAAVVGIAMFVYILPVLRALGVHGTGFFLVLPPVIVLIPFGLPLRRILSTTSGKRLRCFSCGYEEELE